MRTFVVVLALLLGARASASEWEYKLPSGEVVEGTPLSDTPGLAQQVARVRKAVSDALNVEIGNIPVHLVTTEDLRELHNELGGSLKHGWTLYGFELNGHVFVRRALAGVPDDVLIHESLHALSERFAQQLNAQGAHKIVEGITQYLTLEAMAARPVDPRLKSAKNSTYVAYTELADALATLVGENALREAYFGGGLQQLSTRVDAARKSKHVLIRAARTLEVGDERGAISLLTGATK